MKKTLIAISIFAVAAAVFAAYEIDGLHSLSIGRWAGLEAEANRTVVIGAGAGSYMQGGDSNLFVGAAAGLRTDEVTSSVGIGHYAFRKAKNCTRCVGIGDQAFVDADGCVDETRINGQLTITTTNIVFTPAPGDAPVILWSVDSGLRTDRVVVNALTVEDFQGVTIGSAPLEEYMAYRLYDNNIRLHANVPDNDFITILDATKQTQLGFLPVLTFEQLTKLKELLQ